MISSWIGKSFWVCEWDLYIYICKMVPKYKLTFCGLSSFGEVQNSSYRVRRQDMSLIVIRDNLWIARDNRHRCDRLRLFMKSIGYFLKLPATFTRLRDRCLYANKPGIFGGYMQLVKSILVLQVAESPNQDWILLTLPTRDEFLVL